MVSTADGILIPGGFGVRGTEGMVLAARWARENHIPFLGVCLGLQIATIEFTRSVLGRKDSHSAEFYPDIDEKNHVVVFMPEIDKETMGGSMRLGLRPTFFQNETEWSQIKKLYGDVSEVHERHRHRYEINPKMVDELENNGLIFVGKDDTGKRCEILELKNHPYYIATQYHPEYTSKVLDPSKPFLGLVAASAGILQDVIEGKYDLEAGENKFNF